MQTSPKLHFGQALLESLEFRPESALFVTMELPWKQVVPRLRFQPVHVAFAGSMEETALQAAADALSGVDTVVGIGGGSCMDFAKYLAWARTLRLILIPSIVSVDACVTRSIAVRDGGRVRYIGDVKAEDILIDFTLISQSPRRLNRAGAADILSIHTASFDWLLGHKRNRERYDQQIAEQCARILSELEENASDIRSVNEKGIRTLVDLFVAENDLCENFGNARPEEGSEHFFAYNAEYKTQRDFIHGEIVSLGILLMSRLQKNRADWARRLLDRLGVLYRPKDLGLKAGDLRSTLLTLHEYCQDEQLPHTIIGEPVLSPDAVESLISDL
jgi:glycerol-1-phosphate dehydrogenase [NAD(P)+]